MQHTPGKLFDATMSSHNVNNTVVLLNTSISLNKIKIEGMRADVYNHIMDSDISNDVKREMIKDIDDKWPKTM